MHNEVPHLITVGVIADSLGEKLDRVQRVLRKRRDIKPTAYAGHTRLFTSEVIAQVRQELDAIDAKRMGVAQ